MIDTAIEAAKQAGELAYRYFKTNPQVRYKPDKSPVTRADIEAEKLIRKIVSRKFPDHGFIGEELGNLNPKAKYKWVIDPIDGTKAFIRGINTWGTLVAVLENKKPIIGVYASPCTNEIFWAQKSKGAFLNGKRTYVSKVKDLSHAYIIYGAIHWFKKYDKLLNLSKLTEIVEGRRGSSDPNAFNLLLKGKVDAILWARGYIYDFAAPAVLTEEAGGKFSDFSGKFSLNSDNGIFSNGFLHNQVLKILNG